MFSFSGRNVVVMALVGAAASMFAANRADAGSRHGRYYGRPVYSSPGYYRPRCGPVYTRPVIYERPVVVSRPVYYTEPVTYVAPCPTPVYTAPWVTPVYAAPVYTTSVYTQPCATTYYTQTYAAPVTYSPAYYNTYARPAYYSAPSFSFGYASGGHGNRAWGFSVGR